MLLELSFISSLVSLVSCHGYTASFVAAGKTYPGWKPYTTAAQTGVINRAFSTDGAPTPFSSGTAIICNGSNKPANSSATVTAGSTIVANYNFPSQHPGPVMAYLAKCNGPCSEFTDDGPWVKIQQDGYDASQSTPWAMDRLNRAQKWDFKIPKNIEDGEYILRTELLGLHVAGNRGGAQFYPSCAQLIVKGGAGGPWPQGIKISGSYKEDDRGILVDLWRITKTAPTYVPPGGPVLLS